MYKFRLAKQEDMEKILQRKVFDLDLREKPRFYIMTKDQEFLTFAYILQKESYNYIEYIDVEGLSFSEIDFLYRSLLDLLEEDLDLLSPYKQDPFTHEYAEGLYLVKEPRRACGGH